MSLETYTRVLMNASPEFPIHFLKIYSKSTQLPKVAAKVPNGTKPESRVKRFTRWLDNERILEEVYFLPYAEILLAHLAIETLVLVMDGSVVGCGCVALMLHVI